MQREGIQVGDLVTVPYKTGVYIAEVIETFPEKATVKILAVRKHPQQGDLHHPFEVNVPLFHQRRALSYQEKVMVPLSAVTPYTDTVPDYTTSLRNALAKEKEKLLAQQGPWAERALEELIKLETEYFSH
ncbi:MAG: kinase-associated lipoprotein B [Brevibacillus sp.]|nr:kinase-associated lipoprotein B [Brevibacillus sp.]